jgi:hypothetical protein
MSFARMILMICHSIIGLPLIGSNTLPGNLVDSIRACNMATFLNIKD